MQKATFIALIAAVIALIALLAMGAEIFLGDMNPDVITAEACVAGACFVLVIGGVLYKALKK